ncbi:Vascular non-inflammatory molecule 2-like, partial [Homarus americanus]
VVAGAGVKYTGAVLEYEPYDEWGEEGGLGIVRENSRVLAEYVNLAKTQGADIFVAPEYGVTSIKLHQVKGDDLFSLMHYVPDPGFLFAPCILEVDSSNIEAIRTLSCAALENQIYVIVDMGEASPCNIDTASKNPFGNAIDNSYDCPESGYIFYNTQVVFNRNGTVIARYHKKNLFLEPEFMPGTEPDEQAVFTTDFGVTFTLQVCFDIAFLHPGVTNIETHGIKDVVMSTSWVDILPFIIAPSVQNGWSRGLGVNLLVSGYHLPELSKLGSGIYRGFSNMAHDYVYDPESGNKLIVSEVESVASVSGKSPSTPRKSGKTSLSPKGNNSIRVRGSAEGSIKLGRDHLFLYDDLSEFSREILVHGESSEPHQAEVCHQDGLCCSLSYTSTSSLNYTFMAYSGILVEGFGVYKVYAQICSVVWCQTEDISTCARVDDQLPENDEFGPFTITGNFSVGHVYPMFLTRNLTLVQNDLYSIDGNGYTLTMSTEVPTQSLMTTGFYARWYQRDP